MPDDPPIARSTAKEDAGPVPADPAAPPLRRSLMDRLIATSGHMVHKLKAKDTSGRWAYYFVLVAPGREREFLSSVEGEGTVDLTDFGTVLASCYSEQPTPEVKAYLKERYGFDV